MASEATLSDDIKSRVMPNDLDSYKLEFKSCDADGSGVIDKSEIAAAATSLGHKLSDEEVTNLLAEIDINSDGKVSFTEFVKFMEAAKKSGKKEHLMFVKGKGSGAHSWSHEEKEAFSLHVNQTLEDDEFLAERLPIDPTSMDLFNVISDGVVICKLVNAAVPDTVDMRALAYPKKGKALNVWEKTQNINLAIGAAKAIGCRIVNFHAEDMLNCLEKHSEILVLGMLWQIVRLTVTQNINLKACPEIAQLREGDEEIADLLKLKPETLLLRWINYHLRKAGVTDTVRNFGSDLADGTKYVALLHSISPDSIPSVVPADSAAKRAQVVIDAAKSMGVPVIIKAQDIAKAEKNLNLAFCASIFNTVPGLAEVSEEETKTLADLLGDEDASDSREERVFRMWMNSLHLPEDVHSLFDDLHNGLPLLHALDKVNPGCVNWKKVNTKVPMMRFKKGENCSKACKIGKEMGFSLVGIGSSDIMDGNKKLILAFLWQLMRHHLLLMLRELGGGKKINDADIVSWANDTAAKAGCSIQISGFKDKKLKDGRFLLSLVSALEPRAVNMDLVSDDNDMNAKYVISVARKIGASIFLTWEDIVEVKPKMLLTLLASLMLHANSIASGKK